MQEPVDVTNLKKDYSTRKPESWGKTLDAKLIRQWGLKYGENPSQSGAIFRIAAIAEDGKPVVTVSDIVDVEYVRSTGSGKGGLSLTNMMDITRAMDNLKFFMSVPAVAIMKHNIVSGFAKQTDDSQSHVDLYRLARDADLLSNFGGTLVLNRPMTMEMAQAMYELKGKSTFFVDVVAAPEYEHGTIAYIESKSKNIRIAKYSGIERLPRFKEDDTHGLVSFKEMPGGYIGVQEPFLTEICSAEDWIARPMVTYKGEQYAMDRAPTEKEADDLLTAIWLNISGARSNGIVGVNNGVSIAMGSGQVARVEAVRDAIIKGMQKAMDREGIPYDALYGIQGYEQLRHQPFEGASFSSDAYFPFPDSIETLASVGVTAVANPFGSDRDYLAIIEANKHEMAMPCTAERCFGHF